MCRMVGVVFRGEFPIGTLSDLRHVSQVGRIPGEDTPGHRDGWGMVSFRSGSPWYIGRSVREAFLDPSYDSALKEVARLEPPNILIAHVRALSMGDAALPNTHPFIFGNLVLAHNGTVRGFRPRTGNAPKGSTDSELILMRLADLVEQERELWSAMKRLVREEIHGHEYTAAILLASDGRMLLGYRDYAEGQPSQYYDLRVSVGHDWVAMFQETVLGYNGRILQLRNGELVSISLDLEMRREMLV